MRNGVFVSNIDSYADPNVTVELARAADAAGWDALILWDHLGFMWGHPAADPWTVLAAVAASTSTLVLGTSVTPVPRRRPHVLAHQLATLDSLAPGRVVLGAGLGGVPGEFSAFGEEGDARVRAAKLDEGLEVMRALLSGGPVTHDGAHYRVEGVTMQPVPNATIPFWIGGNSPPALRRAARWDGWLPDSADKETMVVAPEQVAEGLRTIRDLRQTDAPFDVGVFGYSNPGDAEVKDAYADAGATWWLEYIHDWRGSVDEMVARVEAGP
jgi:probable F420-dependent oxidoreductase